MDRAIERTRLHVAATPARQAVSLGAVLTMLTALLLVDTAGAFAAAPKPSVTLSPTSGPPGTEVTVSGQNWPAGHSIAIAFPDRGFWGPGSATSSPDGSFTFSFTWPSPASPGEHQVAVIDNTGPVDAPAYPIFTVTSKPAAGTGSDPRQQDRGPSWVAPTAGAAIPYENDLILEAAPIAGAREYLFGFFENGQPVWENYANERRLDGPIYVLPHGSAGHRALGQGANGRPSWPLQLWVRGYVHDGEDRYHWSEASVIDVTLVGFGCINGPGGACLYGPTDGFSVGDARQMSIRTVWDLVKFGNLACEVLHCPAWSDTAASQLVRELGRAEDLVNIALIPANFQRIIDSGNALGDALRTYGKDHEKTRAAAHEFCRSSETAIRGVHSLFPVPGLGEAIFPIPDCPVK